MKMHLSFATQDLARSVEFYSSLLDAEPAKLLSDYALFVTEEPPLELALAAVSHARVNSQDDYGIYVERVDKLDQAIARLEDAGIASSIEREETCCYAEQSKVWAVDPAGRRWEIYTVHQETAERDLSDSQCCTDARCADDAA